MIEVQALLAIWRATRCLPRDARFDRELRHNILAAADRYVRNKAAPHDGGQTGDPT